MKMPEDIPEASRRSLIQKRPPRPKLPLLGLGAIGGVLIVLTLGFWLITQFKIPQVAKQPNPTLLPGDLTAVPPPSNITGNAETLLGHLPYAEAPQAELKPIGGEGRIQLRSAAAQQFGAMVAAAVTDGVDLVPISGFRSLAEQKHLFFDVKAERGQVTTERAEVSAPPGYSEHHTGYVVDIGDSARTETNLSTDFENTAAFEWLQSNAAHFSFELSFPKDNPQGVSYEPWHWRFVGDQHSLETFYKARNVSSGNDSNSDSN